MKLFNSDAVTFICNLDNCIECLVTEEENGLFEVDFTYNIASSEFNEIKNDRVVEVKASDELGLQLFRIYHIANEINGNVYVKAQHITYDLIDNFVEGVTCTNSTCQEAFEAMLNKCQFKHDFKGYSDIEGVGTYNLNRVNALEAIAGTRGSLLDTFGNGAKLKRDNYNIYLNKARGSNKNVKIAYSKNILGYKREIDESEVVTCIYPFAKIQNDLEGGESVEETIVLPERFVNSKYVNNFPHPKILAVDYSEKEIKTIEHLRKEANKYFDETRKDIPGVNYQVEFVYLHQTLEYQSLNLKELELVGMGDTVIVEDYRIGMNVEAKVIRTVFNVLNDRYESIELGRFKGSIGDIIGDLETDIDNALTQINNIYTNFEVLDDKIISEVSKLDGDIKTNTTLIQQTADSITQVTKDVEGNTTLINQTSKDLTFRVDGLDDKYTEIKQTVDGIDLTGVVTFNDLKGNGTTVINGSNITTGTINANVVDVDNINANNIKSGTINANYVKVTNIDASNITSGTVNGNMIKGGVIEGSTLKTSEPTSSGGVWIKQNAIQLGGTAFLYQGSTFKIETGGNTSYSSTSNIHLMPGMSGNTPSGDGIVYVVGKLATNKLVVDGIEINPRGLTAVFG